jgi:glutamine cyclotransferase
MAWVEAASVYYLRAMVDRIDPYQENPLPIRGGLESVELTREAATLVMLLAMGALAGGTWHKRLGYTAIAFGVWDIWYYAFLRMISGWPTSLFDWDVLFLLPLPWWGPVLAPVSIALLMIVGGTFVTQSTDRRPVTSFSWTLWGLNGIGIALALFVFMADSLRTVHQGLDVSRVLPERFDWSMFCVALTLMAAPVAQIGWQLAPRPTLWFLALAASAPIAAGCVPNGAEPAPPPQTPMTVGYEIVREYPHDTDAFTQGLMYRDGFLYESTGPTGRSSLRKVRIETGEVILQRRLDDRYFGEGLTEWNGRLLQLTPMRTEVTVPSALAERDLAALGRRFGINIGSSYDIASFEPQATFTYEGEGWGLTRDDRRLIVSDGTSRLRFLDPEKFYELGRVEVTDHGRPVAALNELEFVNGEVYANIWFEDRIAIVHPDSGQVTVWIDLSGLKSRMVPPPDPAAGAVLNGIAYDVAGDRLFVTGKLWPLLFEIRLRPYPAATNFRISARTSVSRVRNT